MEERRVTVINLKGDGGEVREREEDSYIKGPRGKGGHFQTVETITRVFS